MKTKHDGERIDPGKTAVVTIDIQLDYFRGGAFPLWRSGLALKRARRLLDRARAKGLPIIHIRHESRSPGSRFLIEGSPGTALHPGLGVRPGETILDKHYPNGFRETGLEGQLRGLGVTTVIWAGMITWMCVDTTVRAAKDLGFDNILALDATASGPLLRAGGGWGFVLPWRSQAAFLAALGTHHARLCRVDECLELMRDD